MVAGNAKLVYKLVELPKSYEDIFFMYMHACTNLLTYTIQIGTHWNKPTHSDTHTRAHTHTHTQTHTQTHTHTHTHTQHTVIRTQDIETLALSLFQSFHFLSYYQHKIKVRVISAFNAKKKEKRSQVNWLKKIQIAGRFWIDFHWLLHFS
jgi:hypothetical protein